ncbi:MAG: hypothetical protein OEV42_07290 [Deltaproteobacteria bacterium]|nr:hypothetical protein [Deltaproteobacteria bacterium]
MEPLAPQQRINIREPPLPDYLKFTLALQADHLSCAPQSGSLIEKPRIDTHIHTGGTMGKLPANSGRMEGKDYLSGNEYPFNCQAAAPGVALLCPFMAFRALPGGKKGMQ